MIADPASETVTNAKRKSDQSAQRTAVSRSTRDLINELLILVSGPRGAAPVSLHGIGVPEVP
jgi:hypothetical protein